MKIMFLADDRHHLSKNDYENIFSELQHREIYSLYFVSDMIESVRPYFKDAKYFDYILQKYSLSIKNLVFIWAKLILDINKSFLLDDDILFLKPLDDFYYSNDYARKKDAMSKLCTESTKAIKQTYSEINYDDFIKKRFHINSGSIIYKWNNKHNLVEWMHRFFDSEYVYSFVKNKSEKFITLGLKTKWGRSWQMEQIVYGLFMYSSTGLDIYASFGNLVNTGISKPKEIKPLSKLHSIVHFVNRDKISVYQYYISCLKVTDIDKITSTYYNK